MSKLFAHILTTGAARALSAGLVLLVLSGCASYSLVSNDEIEADRVQREALEQSYAKLVEELVSVTSARGELETQLAVESERRAALEAQLETQLETSAKEIEALNAHGAQLERRPTSGLR